MIDGGLAITAAAAEPHRWCAIFAQGGDLMSSLSTNLRIMTIIRWIARIWSILIFARAVVIVVVPDPYLVKPVPLTDWIELGFYGVAILGLLLAWRWEGLGGTIAIVGVVGHAIAFCIFRGVWFVQAIPVLLYGLPGIFFLVNWAMSRDKRELAGPKSNRSAKKLNIPSEVRQRPTKRSTG
jgi:hypothetical protein